MPWNYLSFLVGSTETDFFSTLSLNETVSVRIASPLLSSDMLCSILSSDVLCAMEVPAEIELDWVDDLFLMILSSSDSDSNYSVFHTVFK